VADRALEGGEVRLRPLLENDVSLLAKWLFDPDVLHWLQLSEDPPQLRTEEAVRERYERTGGPVYRDLAHRYR
jgi:hypothetical protein